MPDPEPGPGQDDEQAASAGGQPGFAWAPGSAETGPPSSPGLDWQALLEALAEGGFLAGGAEGQDAVIAEEQAAAADGRMSAPLPPGRAGALAVEHMPPGPAQAGWLAAAAAEAGNLDEFGLAGVAIAARQLASWATAAELVAVAHIAARAAAADSRIGLAADGRPARLCRDALGQISLALMLTDHAAAERADLAITLCWRLPETGRALAAGVIDLARARVIAEATSVLDQEAARAVEAAVLPGAGRQTTAQLRMRLRRAVIAADPDGAERRRQQAERHAKVSLYADEDGTATLAGAGLPAVEAAAAMARITAIARAMKAAGQGDGLDLHRAKAMLGLLLGTLPYIPPPGGAPEPPPPPGDDHSGAPGGPDASVTGRDPDGHRPGHDGPADDAGPVPPWPVPGAIPPALARRPAAPPDGRPAPGLLDITLPWTTLAGLSAAPGLLGRIGPVTATQARQLATAAAADPAAQWRIIVTNGAGQAITVTRIPRRSRAGPGPPRESPGRARDGPPLGTGLVGRITLTISDGTIGQQAAGGPPLETRASPARPLHLDHPRRTHLHHRPRHIPRLTRLPGPARDPSGELCGLTSACQLDHESAAENVRATA